MPTLKVVVFLLLLFCFVLFCFVLFCFVLFCFVLFCFLDAVSETAIISLALVLTQKEHQDVQLKLFQHHVHFHPDQLKSVRENEAKRFCLGLTL